MKTPKALYRHATEHGRFEEGSSEELMISTDSYSSYFYATNVLEGRFELGENAITNDSYHSYYYAEEILKGRFELGEKAIATEVEFAYQYARDVLNSRFMLGEDVILDSTYSSYYMERFESEFSDEDLVMIKMKYPEL